MACRVQAPAPWRDARCLLHSDLYPSTHLSLAGVNDCISNAQMPAWGGTVGSQGWEAAIQATHPPYRNPWSAAPRTTAVQTSTGGRPNVNLPMLTVSRPAGRDRLLTLQSRQAPRRLEAACSPPNPAARQLLSTAPVCPQCAGRIDELRYSRDPGCAM